MKHDVFQTALTTMQTIFVTYVDPLPVLLHLLFLEYNKEIVPTTKVTVEVVVAAVTEEKIEDLGIIILKMH